MSSVRDGRTRCAVRVIDEVAQEHTKMALVREHLDARLKFQTLAAAPKHVGGSHPCKKDPKGTLFLRTTHTAKWNHNMTPESDGRNVPQ